jgi:hypothetical protein
MAKTYDSTDERLAALLGAQKVFFVATARYRTERNTRSTDELPGLRGPSSAPRPDRSAPGGAR